MLSFPLLSLLAIGVAVLILWLIRRDQLPISHSLWWLTIAAIILAFGLIPGLIDSIAGIFGVAYPPSMVFIIAILTLIVRALLEDLEVTRTRRRQIRMAQKISMLEQQLDELRDKQGAADAQSDERPPAEH